MLFIVYYSYYRDYLFNMIGVIRGLASMKFSGSDNVFGLNIVKIIKIVIDIINSITSFNLK